MHLVCGTREVHVKVDSQISVLPMLWGRQTHTHPVMTSFTHPFAPAPRSVTGATCYPFILLFVEYFIEDEHLERGQGQNSG